MGGHPQAANNALVGNGMHATLDVRMKALARVHAELIDEMATIESINYKTDRSIIQSFVHVLSDSHLPQRPCTYVGLRFGVPINPFMSRFKINNDAMETPFWLTWNDLRGCYGISQMRTQP